MTSSPVTSRSGSTTHSASPLDLTQDALRARDIAVDTDAFNAAMEKQKEEARAAWKGSGDAATETVWFEIRDRVGATEFLGYDTEKAEGVITAIVKDGGEVKSLKAGDEAQIIVNQTPFYGESGGQVGDAGTIAVGPDVIFEVSDTQKKLGDLFVHAGKLTKGKIRIGDAVELEVDHARRSAIRANHSATHLIHEALRQVLGTHVAQKGSLVSPDRLRFDISHPKPVEPEELERVEAIANAVITHNDPVETRLMAYDDALETGAMALFGEKYGDEVRVVSMVRAGSGRQRQPGMVRRTVWRHPREAYRRHRDRSRDRRDGLGRGRTPYRGSHRRWRPRLPSGSGCPRARTLLAPPRAAGRPCQPGHDPSPRNAASSNANLPMPSASSRSAAAPRRMVKAARRFAKSAA